MIQLTSLYAGSVNKKCEQFKIPSITDAHFKCLIFVCGLRSQGDAEVRARVLSKIEKNPDITQQVAVACQRLVNLKHDSHMVQQSELATTLAVNAIQKQQNSTPPGSTHKKSTYACWNCGGWYFTQKYPFKTHHSCKCKK